MANILDTFGVQEVFVEALAGVERIGPNRRLVFATTVPDGDGTPQQVAVVKLTLSAEAALQVAQAILSDGSEVLSELECSPATRPN